MANPKEEELLRKGAKAWNDSFAELVRETSPDLSEARLSECNLTGAFLREADLKNADLSHATLESGTVLWKADLSGAKLDWTKLRGADLREAKFIGAHFLGTNLREADLKGADLGQFQGSLLSEHLAGSDLTGATLPEPLTKRFESLDTVKDISQSARKLFVAMLAACLYSWLTIATTTDVNLITNRTASPLPIIQASIPIVGFYVVAPLLVVCVYFYFHFYLQKLWEELGSLPAVFPDGRPLNAKVDPWLLNDLVRAHLPKLSINRPFLSYFQLWISVLLAWGVVPITMLLFWGRYLRRHELVGTTFHVVLLVVSVLAAIRLYQLAKATLCGAERRPFTWKKLLTSRRSYQTAAFACLAAATFGLLSLGAIRGVRSGAPVFEAMYQFQWEKGGGFSSRPLILIRGSQEYLFYEGRGPRTWLPRIMAAVGYPPFANLESAEVSQKKPTWSEKDRDLDSVIRAHLAEVDLRYASASGAFFAGAMLRGADLTGADLQSANLAGADLGFANLSDSRLLDADLRGSILVRANLSPSSLGGARLDNANLKEANLRYAELGFGASLKGADLRYADLTAANLLGTDLSEADLSEADLTGAHLNGADLDYCNFISAKNLTPSQVKEAHHWEDAFYDSDMLRLLDLAPGHNQKLAQQYAKRSPLKEMPHWVKDLATR